MIVVAHEIPQPDVFYPEVARILKPGSRLAIVEWLPQETLKGPAVNERLSPDTLAQQLKKNGFIVVKNEFLNENQYLLVARKSPTEP